jgi:cell division protein FtsN
MFNTPTTFASKEQETGQNYFGLFISFILFLMGPLRKKTKPNPPNVATTNDQADENDPMPTTTKPTTESLRPSTDAANEDAPTPLKAVKDASAKQVRKTSSATI